MNIAFVIGDIYQNRKTGFRDIGEGHALVTLHNGNRYYIDPQLDGTYEVNQTGVVGCGYGYTVEEAANDLFRTSVC